MKNNKLDDSGEIKPVSWWKRVVIIILIVAMPLFFWFIRNIQMQQAMTSSEPEQGTDPALKHNPEINK